jgi:hypothetical protein
VVGRRDAGGGRERWERGGGAQALVGGALLGGAPGGVHHGAVLVELEGANAKGRRLCCAASSPALPQNPGRKKRTR